jgi:hypothetical protein
MSEADRATVPIPSGAVARLAVTKPDAERAAEHKARIASKLVELCVLMDEAKADGFITNFQLGIETFQGRNVVQALILAKQF